MPLTRINNVEGVPTLPNSSQATLTPDGRICISGQYGHTMNEDGEVRLAGVGEVEQQLYQALKNMEMILHALDSDWGWVTMIQFRYIHAADLGALNNAYSAFMEDRRQISMPSLVCYQVRGLPNSPGAIIVISAEAIVRPRGSHKMEVQASEIEGQTP